MWDRGGRGGGDWKRRKKSRGKVEVIHFGIQVHDFGGDERVLLVISWYQLEEEYPYIHTLCHPSFFFIASPLFHQCPLFFFCPHIETQWRKMPPQQLQTSNYCAPYPLLTIFQFTKLHFRVATRYSGFLFIFTALVQARLSKSPHATCSCGEAALIALLWRA